MRENFTPIRILGPYYFEMFMMLLEKREYKERQAAYVKFCNRNEKSYTATEKIIKKLVAFIDPCGALIWDHLIDIGVLPKDKD